MPAEHIDIDADSFLHLLATTRVVAADHYKSRHLKYGNVKEIRSHARAEKQPLAQSYRRKLMKAGYGQRQMAVRIVKSVITR